MSPFFIFAAERTGRWIATSKIQRAKILSAAARSGGAVWMGKDETLMPLVLNGETAGDSADTMSMPSPVRSD